MARLPQGGLPARQDGRPGRFRVVAWGGTAGADGKARHDSRVARGLPCHGPGPGKDGAEHGWPQRPARFRRHLQAIWCGFSASWQAPVLPDVTGCRNGAWRTMAGNAMLPGLAAPDRAAEPSSLATATGANSEAGRRVARHGRRPAVRPGCPGPGGTPAAA